MLTMPPPAAHSPGATASTVGVSTPLTVYVRDAAGCSCPVQMSAASPGPAVGDVGAGASPTAAIVHTPPLSSHPSGTAGRVSVSAACTATAPGLLTVRVYETFHEASGFCVAGSAPVFTSVGNAGSAQPYTVWSSSPVTDSVAALRNPPGGGSTRRGVAPPRLTVLRAVRDGRGHRHRVRVGRRRRGIAGRGQCRRGGEGRRARGQGEGARRAVGTRPGAAVGVIPPPYCRTSDRL